MGPPKTLSAYNVYVTSAAALYASSDKIIGVWSKAFKEGSWFSCHGDGEVCCSGVVFARSGRRCRRLPTTPPDGARKASDHGVIEKILQSPVENV